MKLMPMNAIKVKHAVTLSRVASRYPSLSARVPRLELRERLKIDDNQTVDRIPIAKVCQLLRNRSNRRPTGIAKGSALASSSYRLFGNRALAGCDNLACRRNDRLPKGPLDGHGKIIMGLGKWHGTERLVAPPTHEYCANRRLA